MANVSSVYKLNRETIEGSVRATTTTSKADVSLIKVIVES